MQLSNIVSLLVSYLVVSRHRLPHLPTSGSSTLTSISPAKSQQIMTRYVQHVHVHTDSCFQKFGTKINKYNTVCIVKNFCWEKTFTLFAPELYYICCVRCCLSLQALIELQKAHRMSKLEHGWDREVDKLKRVISFTMDYCQSMNLSLSLSLFLMHTHFIKFCLTLPQLSILTILEDSMIYLFF